MITIASKFEEEAKIIAYTIDWLHNPAHFYENLAQVDPSTWHTYKYLLVHYFSSQATDVTLKLLSFYDLFEIITQKADLIINKTALYEHIADVFELLLEFKNHDHPIQIVELYERYLVSAVESNNMSLELFLMIGQRLNGKSVSHCSTNLKQTTLRLLHSKTITSPLFAKCMLFIDKICSVENTESIFDVAWTQIRSCNTSQTANCDTCYASMTHLLPFFLRNSVVFERLLCDQLFWSFIRDGFLSGEIQRSKQTMYMLKLVVNLLQKHREFKCIADVFINPEILSTEWDMYFTAIESLYEIQGHLILSTMDNYLNDIVQNFSSSWQNILFSLLLQHSHMQVSRYGVLYVTQNHIDIYASSHLSKAFYMAINQTHLYTENKTETIDLASFFISNMNNALDGLVKINWKLVPLWFALKAIAECIRRNATDRTDIDISLIIKFITIALEALARKRAFEQHAIRIVIDIVERIGLNRLQIGDILNLYEITRHQKLLEQQPAITSFEFEQEVLCRSDISSRTKVQLLSNIITDLNKRLDFLDSFQNVSEVAIIDYEILLFHNLAAEKSVADAVQLIKSRLYNVLKPKDGITVDSLFRAVTILEYIATKYVSKDENRANVLPLIKDAFDNMCLAAKTFKSTNGTLITTLDRLRLIDAVLCLDRMVYNDMKAYKCMCDALMVNEYELNLHRFKSSGNKDMVQMLFTWYLDLFDGVKIQTKAKNIIIMLETFDTLQCPIKSVFDILTLAEAPIDVLFGLAQAKTTPEFNEMIVESLLFGKELKGEQRQEYEIAARIDPINATYNQSVRLAAMRYIQQLNCPATIEKLKDLLNAKHIENSRARYFNNSIHHELKLRYMQAFALLHQRAPAWNEQNLRGLLHENNQMNITYINELIIAETISIDRFTQLINEINGNKGLQSLCIIGYYVCCKNKFNIHLCHLFIKYLMKWIFAKNLSVRLTAQAVLIRLIERFDLIDAYKLIYNNIRNEQEVSGGANRLKKWCPLEDIRLNSIDFEHLLSSVYFLREIPRLTQMCADEIYYTPLADFDEKLLITSAEVIGHRELCDREAETDAATGDHEVPNSISTKNTQKKIVPMKQTTVCSDLLNNLPYEFQLSLDTYKSRSELIVVASLVTKVPNLGGISRTCEVLCVKGCVINNLNDVNRSEFLALSMGSEKWLKYIEVKPQYLSNYLITMQMQGYKIVGAEQTTFSEPLQHTMLPQKMVLVLGQEKDGIPPNIMNLLDLAVEIPQFGVVRSLNVHVTASLFMWEYCKQHIIGK